MPNRIRIKLARDLSDHDLIRIDGEKYMVDWTVGLRDRGMIRVGLVPREGGSSFHQDIPYETQLRYDGRA